jgi:metal-responsive CopG/Arc/MetJ family transcriptional regulator
MRRVQSISVTVPTDLIKALEKIQEEETRSCSNIVAEAIRQYVGKNDYIRLVKEISADAKKAGIVSEEDIDRAVHEAKREKNKNRR